MEYLYYQLKMEPIRIKKRTRQIPFGFKQSETHKDYIEPIKTELQALDQAKKYLKTCSYRETAKWLTATTKRYISQVGLRKRVKLGTTSEAEVEKQTASQEISQTDSSDQT